MFVGLYDDVVRRILYGEACSCHQVYSLAPRGDPARCGEREGTTHWVGTMGTWRYSIFHKIIMCVSVFLSSVDLGMYVLKLEVLGEKRESLVQKNACCRQANLLGTQRARRTQAGWYMSAPPRRSAWSRAAFLSKQFLMCSKMPVGAKVWSCTVQYGYGALER